MSDFKPIFPGTPEYAKALNDVKNLQEPGVGLAVTFDEVPLGTADCVLKHTIVAQDDEVSKIIFLFAPAATSVMTDVSVKLRILTEQLNIAGSYAEAEISPIFNKQFDYVLFGVPDFRVEDIRNYLVRELLAIYK